jgi:hypothetical protein
LRDVLRSNEKAKMSIRLVRETGFSLPLHPLQVLGWVLMTTLTVTYFVLTVPALPPTYQAVFSAVYSTALTVTVVLGYICTKCNPTDPTVYLERQSRLNLEPFDDTNFPKVCRICKTHVLQHSRHCGQCNRCVNGFDHHCKWLNNCIGQGNYRTFIVLIGTLEILTLWQTAVVLYCLVQVISDGSHEQQRLIKAFGIGRSGIDAFKAISAVSIAISSLVAIAVLHLIALHLFLNARGLTTYEYILQIRERQMAKVADSSTRYENSYEPYVNKQQSDDFSHETTSMQPRLHGFSLIRPSTPIQDHLVTFQPAIREASEEDSPLHGRVMSLDFAPDVPAGSMESNLTSSAEGSPVSHTS